MLIYALTFYLNKMEMKMALDTLEDVYIDQLQDIYSANNQSRNAVKKLHDAASNSSLKDALAQSASDIEDGMNIIKDIIKNHNEDPTGEFCKGMEGIVKEVHAHVLDANYSDDDVRDAMIITQYQRMEHYAIAGYGCVLAFAKRLGHHEDAKKIQECLDGTYDSDRKMTALAMGEINKKAA